MSDVTVTPVEASGPIQGVETPAVETPQTTQPEETLKPQDFLAPKFAALTRKEKMVRAEAARVAAERAEIQKMREEYESKSKASQESESAFIQKLKANPLKALKEHGYDFEKLMEMQLNDENPTPQMQMQMLEEKLRAEMEEKYGKLTETLKEKETREAQEQYDRAVNGYKAQITDFVTQNADTYELILNNAATDLLYETAEEYWKQYGEVPDNKKIADAVEAHLEEQANQIFKLKKFQKLQPKTEPKAIDTKAAPTLSNTLSAEVPKSGTKQLSEQQSLELAASLLRWGGKE